MTQKDFSNSLRIDLTGPRIVGIALILCATLTLALAVFYSASVPALVGIGLAFWGIILTFVESDEYVKTSALNTSSTSLMSALDQALQEIGLNGKAIYLPPRFFSDTEALKIYLPREDTEWLPKEITQKIDRQLSIFDHGILLTPPGAELAKLFEQTVHKSFAGVDFDYLQNNLPKLLVEDLEIVRDFGMHIVQPETSAVVGRANREDKMKSDVIHARIIESVYKETLVKVHDLPVVNSMGCPLVSAIAISIAKATGRPVKIGRYDISDDFKRITIEYNLIEEG